MESKSGRQPLDSEHRSQREEGGKISSVTHTPGFKMTIGRQTNLGIARLIVEDEQGHYEPINLASTIDEAREMAIGDSQHRAGGGRKPLEKKRQR